jgi:N-acetylated-alpha-linked acidic dipeptidase
VRARVNRGLRQVEQVWLHDEGIPGRPWFKHLLYAPRYTYAAMTLPGITEAAEEGNWSRAAAQLSLVADAVGRNTKLAGTIAAELPSTLPADGLEARCGVCETRWMGG